MNSISTAMHWEADAIFQWFDNEPSLRVAIITGAGKKAFCAGQDLVEQAKLKGATDAPKEKGLRHPTGGFCGVSRRTGKKPIIAAVNGFALGGGFEICLNCDMVIAAPNATFGLPEVQVGLYAAAGGLSRVMRTAGLQVASEIALTARRLTAPDALGYHLINKIAKSQESVVDEALEVAKRMASLSPDGIIITRAGLREAWETGSVERATQRTSERYDKLLFEGENMKIGVEAFAAKKKPLWVPSKI